MSRMMFILSVTKIILIQSLRDCSRSGRPGCRPGVGDSDLSAFHVLRVELNSETLALLFPSR